MKFSLIICTYNRPQALLGLLESVLSQSRYPEEVLVIDGSENDDTKVLLQEKVFPQLRYFKVAAEDRGLTKQRNFGIRNIAPTAEIMCFLDDDIILHQDYFRELLLTYEEFPEALGASGYILNETDWRKVPENYQATDREFMYDGWVRKEGSRFRLRRKFGLQPDQSPGIMPAFSHGYSTGFLPPSGKTYEVELLMGGIASYKKEVFKKLQFSPFFEGYGLYEDADFSLRVSKLGKLYVNTKATLEHHHAAEGRPNSFRYGKMVVRNGWYVWRVKNRKPVLRERFKWHATSFLLTLVRLSNSINTGQRREALNESLGRVVGWGSLWFHKPPVEKKQ